jgi:hypothetical protein
VLDGGLSFWVFADYGETRPGRVEAERVIEFEGAGRAGFYRLRESYH